GTPRSPWARTGWNSGRRSPPRGRRRPRAERVGGSPWATLAPECDGNRKNQPMRPWSRELVGRLDEHVLDSDALKGNRLGAPPERPLWVYTPPGAGETRLPSLYLIQGMTGQVVMWRNRSAFRPSVVELIDALFADEGCPPARVVFVDAWTSYGGSQFLDSPGTGNYHTYLCEEVVPFVDASYPTLADAAHRGIAGKSSGGCAAPGRPEQG